MDLKLNNRQEIASFISRIEREFDVNEWKVNNIHFWPLIRIELFFFLARLEIKNKVTVFSTEKLPQSKKKPIKISIISQLNKLVRYYFSLQRKKYVFVGSDAHRVTLKEKRYNRFFDPIIDSLNLRNDSIYLEYGKLNKASYYHEESIFNTYAIQKSYLFVADFFNRYLKRNDTIHFGDYQKFIDFLNSYELTLDFSKKFTSIYLRETYLKLFMQRYNFYTVIFKKIKPSKIFVLCYYDYQILPLIAAANSNNIKTVDFQHGPQPDVHLAYSGWNSIPARGYAVLPKQFWNWNVTSSDNINKWAKATNIYSSFIGGNTWISFWSNLKNEYQFKNYILYSLQPDPLDINDLFCESIIKSIKQHDFIWFIRLHPRQLNMVENYKTFVAEQGIIDKVNFENATFDPLPVIIQNAILHVTHFSGTAIEAAMMGKHSLLLHPNALDCFPDLIENRSATYINYCSNDFQEKFSNLVTSLRQCNQENNIVNTIDYSGYFK